MKNYIFGTGKFACEIAKIFDKYGIKVDGFINVRDKNKSLPTSMYKDIPVYYVEEFDIVEKENSNIFLAKKPMFMGSGIEFFRNNKFKNLFAINEEIFFDEIDNIIKLNKYIDPIDLTRPFLNYLEINLVDNCNLNCKGCAHFSNICDKNYVEVEQFERDLKKLTEHFELYNFRLLGGEPLLHPNLKEIIEISRRYLPNSRLIIVTNGLLLDKLSPKILKSISDNKIIITISLYQPTFKKLNSIVEILTKYNIKYLINDDIFRKIETIQSFHTRLTDEKKDGDFSANKSCSGRFCRFIRDGKISKCYLPLLVEVLNKKYGKKFEVSEKDYILLDDIKDGWDTIDKLNGDIPFCQYCRDELYDFEWESGRINDDFHSYVLKKNR